MSWFDHADFLKDFNNRMETALEKGWTLQKSNNRTVLVPPKNHPAFIDNWVAHYYPVTYKGQSIQVPNWFWTK